MTGERESEPRKSVLDVIGDATGDAPGVSLPADDDEGSPVELDPRAEVAFSPRTRGDYHVLGEVARGGMGAVLRAHDRDLRRDVAIKVLDERLAGRPEVVRRFVEEAQVGAQLQHPGMVPVYELGLMADERPFFTMKLVKGRTLASLLSARETPATDVSRFLSIFEQVAQTLAYAHSKGVLHRDVKPANVMVGAFGEVQLVDWGLAKVLDRGGVADEERAIREAHTVVDTVRSGPGSSGSDSIVGSVMGTPAYMSPEQARGEVESLDERTDVFALGAVLCETLTGTPPYLETEDEPVAVQAARALLGPARERIESSGADEALQRLCLDCLAPAPRARPASADAVARAIRDYVTGTEERAREAGIAAREARIKADEERKRRRLTLALAAAVVTLVVLAGGGYVWIEDQRATRLAEARTQVDSLHDEAVELQAAGDHDAALAKAREAFALARERVAGSELETRMEQLVGRAATLADDARAVRELEARNRGLFESLDAIALLRSQLGLTTTNEDVDRAYAAAFLAYGLDLESDDLVATLDALRERGMGAELARVLDEWARYKRALHGWRSAEAEALTALAADLDPDPLRTEVRATLVDQDTDRLFALQGEMDVDAVEPATILVLVGAVTDLRGDPRELLERAVRRHPDDSHLRTFLGLAYEAELQGRLAVRELEAAHALDPDNAYVTEKLADSLVDAARYPAALDLYRGLEQRMPEFRVGIQKAALCLLMLGDYADALAEYERAWDAAAIAPRGGVEREVARYLSGAQTSAELASALEEAAEQGPYNRWLQSWALCTHPDPDERDPERALSLAQDLRTVLTEYVLALAYHRLERYEDVLAALATIQPFAGHKLDAAVACASLRAMAHHGLGDDGAAREQLAEAREWFDLLVENDRSRWQASFPRALLREAEARIE